MWQIAVATCFERLIVEQPFGGFGDRAIMVVDDILVVRDRTPTRQFHASRIVNLDQNRLRSDHPEQNQMVRIPALMFQHYAIGHSAQSPHWGAVRAPHVSGRHGRGLPRIETPEQSSISEAAAYRAGGLEIEGSEISCSTPSHPSEEEADILHRNTIFSTPRMQDMGCLQPGHRQAGDRSHRAVPGDRAGEYRSVSESAHRQPAMSNVPILAVMSLIAAQKGGPDQLRHRRQPRHRREIFGQKGKA
ncbi:hypothetical protein [Sphingomonas sp. Root710]|uniref:hypothetical protein n=1 Tax=Sphingomonas sp. Root710 TaxID=1736594 RepID=UPI000B3069DA|nr:hypothetical protein [Sphingomonas sp. Root710]